MWIALNDAFFSIVRTADLPAGHLLVRARRPGDIERYFPQATVKRTPQRDYLFRAVLPEGVVASAIAQAVTGIDYPNFKDSVADDALHSAYEDVWFALADVQPVPPTRA